MTDAAFSQDGQTQQITVVKLGGSLLDLDDLTDRLVDAVTDVAAPVVIVGGGRAADLVRRWHEQGLIDSREAHRLAIAAMSFNGRQLAASDDRLAFAESTTDVQDVLAGHRIPVLDVTWALHTEQAAPGRLPLPESWDVTSDSIAAWLARAWNARLTLLKSVSPGNKPGIDVDTWFERATKGLTELTWINLRELPKETICLTIPWVDRRG